MKFISFRLCLAAVIACAFTAEAAPADKPNVIVIMADDLGAADAGCYGAKDIETPHLDSLARRGVRFSQFYSAAPVCSPSRAGLMTGRYPLRAGLITNASSDPGGKVAVPATQITLAEMCKAAGYTTAHIGKWHLGYTPDTMPNAQGFDLSFGHMGGCIDNYSHFFYWGGPNRHDLHSNGAEVHYPGRFFGDLMVEEAAKFMTQNKGRPFFIYFALNMPHYPYQGDPKWLANYKHLPPPRDLYAAFVSTLDERLGALLKSVDDLGLRERTIVIFQSDNGHSTEERAFGGGGSAGIYRGQKFSLFEGGIRLPGIISWPGHLPEDETRDQAAHSCDWMPTIAELTGAKLLDADIDGKSLVPVIRSATAPSPHDVLHWHVIGKPNAPQWAVRQGDWKLIGNLAENPPGDLTPADRKLFLSNPVRDPSEKSNLAPQNPEVVQRLLKLHNEWLAAQNTPPATESFRDKKGNEQ